MRVDVDVGQVCIFKPSRKWDGSIGPYPELYITTLLLECWNAVLNIHDNNN